MRIVRYIVPLLLVCCGISDGRPTVGLDSASVVSAGSPIGLWTIPSARIKADLLRIDSESDRRIRLSLLPDILSIPEPFYFDGETVTVQLHTHKDWMWRSEDDLYRLKTKWKGNDLFYRPPFADWRYLATFENGFFQVHDDPNLWVFERRAEGELPDDLRCFVKTREKHDYSITPS
jgi:hypothetical protein